MISEVFQTITSWYVQHINYYTITALMTVESSFIPFPSEIVVPPAAWKAAQGELNIFWVIFFSTLGAILGALINYFLAISLGRAIIYKFADSRWSRFFLIDRKVIEKSEDLFRKYGRSSTFFGRLIPAVRQLISLPAGLARMNLKDFIFYTTLGGGLWNIILAMLGMAFYSQKELLASYYHELSLGCVILGIGFVLYVLSKVILFKKK